LAALLVTVSASSQSQPQWRCKAEEVVGVDVSDDLRPVRFSNRPEYRIVPAAELRSRFRVNDDARLMLAEDAEAYIRTTEDNPDSLFSWSRCNVWRRKEYDGNSEELRSALMGDKAHPAHAVYRCSSEWSDETFVLNTHTRRFHSFILGNWHEGDENMYHENVVASDYVLYFGTCKPYYD
jgi:hypothetical protein